MSSLSIAVVTGGHSYDVRGFRDLFRNLPDVDAYVQHIDDFCSSSDEVRDSYDAVVLYFMPAETPTDKGNWYQGKQATVMQRLMAGTGQGIVVLHHAILAYLKWDAWADFVDIQERSFEYDHDQTIDVKIVDSNHPITQGLSDFTIVDETYLMSGPTDACHVLMRTDHPRCIEQIAWVRTVGSSKVFTLQLGHDATAWANAAFQTILSRGIRWVAQGATT